MPQREQRAELSQLPEDWRAELSGKGKPQFYDAQKFCRGLARSTGKAGLCLLHGVWDDPVARLSPREVAGNVESHLCLPVWWPMWPQLGPLTRASSITAIPCGLGFSTKGRGLLARSAGVQKPVSRWAGQKLVSDQTDLVSEIRTTPSLPCLGDGTAHSREAETDGSGGREGDQVT